MTAIVALEAADGVVWLGSDSWIGDGDTADRVSGPKVARIAGWVVGYAGTAGTAQAVLDAIEPTPQRGRAIDRWIRDTMRRAGKRALDDLPGDVEQLDVAFLVIAGGQVWSVDDRICVSRSAHGYAAIGAGAAVALGALHATRRQRDPRRRVTAALHAAVAHAHGVAAPLHVEAIR